MKTKIFILLFYLLTNNALAWDKKFYDPKETENSIILPMPCDGAMVFQIIKTGSINPLDDKAIILGTDDDESQEVLEYNTTNYIAGSFGKVGEERYFLLGKYEVSKLQYEAVMNDKCPKPEIKKRIPITNISWFDAVNFSNRYNEWLIKNHPDKLPKEDNKNGFIRLPTNTEWEFAARGGTAVSESEFRENIFPIPEGEDSNKYIWSSSNANGNLQVSGLLNPNPLGLFDILGNASEMMFNPFSLNKLNRYHGQSGGIIVRGGSYLTSKEHAVTSFKVENDFYNEKGTFKAKDVGFRLALVSPIITSNKRLKELDKAWKSLGKSNYDDYKDDEIADTLDDIVKNIGNKEENKKLKQQLHQIKDVFLSSNQAKYEQRNRALQSSLQLGSFLCTNVAELNISLINEKNRKELLCKEKIDDNCQKFEQKVSEALEVRNFVARYYADTVVEVASDYNIRLIDEQLPLVRNKLENQGKSNLKSFLEIFYSHLLDYTKNSNVNFEAWQKDCIALQERNFLNK